MRLWRRWRDDRATRALAEAEANLAAARGATWHIERMAELLADDVEELGQRIGRAFGISRM